MGKVLNENVQRFTKSQVAKEAGINIETIRYYERNNLIAEPERNESGYRQYTTEDIGRIKFIRQSQELGFSLKEISQILSMRADNKLNCGVTLSFSEKKIQEIDEKIRKLEEMKLLLKSFMKTCREEPSVSECPIVEEYMKFKG
jgi:Hg(II)-responsive transcriptional regulator